MMHRVFSVLISALFAGTIFLALPALGAPETPEG